MNSNSILFTPVASLNHQHRFTWLRNDSANTHGIYRCSCTARRVGALNFNAPNLRGTDLAQVAAFKE